MLLLRRDIFLVRINRSRGEPYQELWRKCMGIEPTCRLTQTVHRI
jgi:hypothetical protein